jgi:hypothetical protein
VRRRAVSSIFQIRNYVLSSALFEAAGTNAVINVEPSANAKRWLCGGDSALLAAKQSREPEK